MTTKGEEVRARGEKELEAEVGQLREQLFKLRWQAGSGQLENPNKIREVRRSIARHLTVLGERQRAASKTGETP
jgi:large subunit ribosomal protein L29